MKIKNVTKLWQGKYLSIRDYELQDAIRKGGLRLTYENKIMELKPEELKNLKPSSNIFQSQYKGSYRLVDIMFKPLTDDPRQRKLEI